MKLSGTKRLMSIWRQNWTSRFGGAEIMFCGTRVIIYAARPGLVIGRLKYMELTRLLEEKFKLQNPQIVSEIKCPELNMLWLLV
jgi:ribosomal protein S3